MDWTEGQVTSFNRRVGPPTAGPLATPCRLWTGLVWDCHVDHYGRVPHAPWYSHRMAYALAYGHLTPGLEVLHACDRILCCEPRHLTEGTHAENMQDMVRKGRWRHGVVKHYLTAAEIEEIHAKYATGRYTLRGLAREYSVHHKTITLHIRARIDATKHRGIENKS